MSQTQILPICSSCNKPVMPGELAVKFYCPNCGESLIWRGEKCRTFSREYKCVNCGFQGP